MSFDLHVHPRGWLAPLAVGAALLAFSSAGAFAATAVTAKPITLMDGPVKGALAVATVPAGAHVGILWCGARGRLCLVSFHDKAGFTRLDDLEFRGSLAVLDGGGGKGGAGSGSATGDVTGARSGSVPDGPRSLAETNTNQGGGNTPIKITKPLAPF
jgi:hypothetical protein